MSQLPPPPPPAETIAATAHAEPPRQKKGRKGLIVAGALALLAAVVAAVVIFIPSVSALVGIPAAAPSNPAAAQSNPAPADGAAGSESATAAASSTAPAQSPSATPTFQMAQEITSAPAVAPSSAPAVAPAAPSTSPADLGLLVPVKVVPCDGSYLTFYASAITPGSYASEIQAALNKYPGSSYLVTEGSRSALNQVSRNGTRIYAVYSGPHSSAASACQALAGVSGAYVKLMSPSTTPEASVTCS